jgi:hypothetical protein
MGRETGFQKGLFQSIVIMVTQKAEKQQKTAFSA